MAAASAPMLEAMSRRTRASVERCSSWPVNQAIAACVVDPLGMASAGIWPIKLLTSFSLRTMAFSTGLAGLPPVGFQRLTR